MKSKKLISMLVAGMLAIGCMPTIVSAAEVTTVNNDVVIASDGGIMPCSYVTSTETTIITQNTYKIVHVSTNEEKEDGVIVTCISKGGGNRSVDYYVKDSNGKITTFRLTEESSKKLKLSGTGPFAVYAKYSDGSTGTIQTGITLGKYQELPVV